MKKAIITVILSCFVSNTSFGITLKRLESLGGSHPSHLKLHHHPFLDHLKFGTIRREQLAQLFKDRAYITQIMESHLPASPEELEPYFYRSKVHEEELRNLMGSWVHPEVSEAARSYGIFLENQEPEVVALHLWLFLVGETYGAIASSKKISKLYDRVGTSSRDFGGLSPKQARERYSYWLVTALSLEPENAGEFRDGVQNVQETRLQEKHYLEQFEIAFEHFFATYDAAYEISPLSAFTSVRTVVSERCYLYLGF